MESVIVTGASGGIGSEIARLFAKNGYGVILHYNKNEEKARRIAREILDRGGCVCAFGADLKCFEQADSLAEFAQSEFGGVSVLINNAGIAQQKLFCDITDSDYDNMMDTDLKSCFNMSKAVLPMMISKKSGSIVNISSMWGITGGSCEVHYSAAKAGIIGLTKALAKEAGPSGITVNCIAPGVINTRMNEKLSPDDVKALCDETPLGKIGEPADVAEAALFLARAKFITGQTLAVDGGITV